MAWYFTKDRVQTLATLFHDLGTPSFSHCIDYLLNDPLNQESSEINVAEIIKNSKQIKNLLEEDNINIEDVIDVSIYSILENKSPKLCVDRLDGILATVLVWTQTWNINDIRELYKHIIIITNEDGNLELGFDSKKAAEKFFDAIFDYSIILQTDEDKYTVQFIADTLSLLIEYKEIEFQDFYILSEKEIIEKINNNYELSKYWKIFNEAKAVSKSDEEPKAEYYVSVLSKKKYVIPLCKYKGKNIRVDKISKRVDNLLNRYLGYKDKDYCYIEDIKMITKK